MERISKDYLEYLENRYKLNWVNNQELKTYSRLSSEMINDLRLSEIEIQSWIQQLRQDLVLEQNAPEQLHKDCPHFGRRFWLTLAIGVSILSLLI